jgi:hypothetical protein
VGGIDGAVSGLSESCKGTNMRKVVIVLISLAVVGLVYWLYSQLSDSTSLEPPASFSAHELQLPESKDAQAFGQTVIHQAEQSRYVELDPQTKAVKRVFGFSRLLNPGSQSLRWQVERPYIIFYEPSFECQIEADNGQFQIERAGSTISPRDGQLEGNVVIHVIPKPGSDLAETYLRLDDLLFSSERTEFSTDGPVQMTSSQIELLGRGLVLLFNAQDGQVEYLHVLDLELIRIKNFVEAQKNIKTSTPATKEEPVVARDTKVAKPATAAAEESKAAKAPKAPETVPLYQCIIDTNVKIHYGSQIIVKGADQVDIQNIVLTRDPAKPAQKTESPAKDASESTAAKTNSEVLPTPSQEQQSSPSTAVAQVEPVDERQDVLVTCDGGIIFELLSPIKEAGDIQAAGKATASKVKTDSISGDSKQTAIAGNETDRAGATPFQASASTALQPGETVLQPPALFEAPTISFDLQTGSGRGTGPVRFVFYQEADPNSTTATAYWPVEITADGDTQFIAGADRQIEKILFNQNVHGVRTRPFESFTQSDAFHSDVMEVMMGTGSTDQKEIQKITLHEGDVFAESIRSNGVEKLAHTRLSCQQILYNVLSEGFVASGPGEIVWNNKQAEPGKSTAAENGTPKWSDRFRRPSSGQIRKFDKIEWVSQDHRLVADGNEDVLEMYYFPAIEDANAPLQMITAAAGRIETTLAPSPEGKMEVSKLIASDRVYFADQYKLRDKEADAKTPFVVKHTLSGYTMVYDAANDGWLSIKGKEDMPCMVDGARVPYIHYNVLTGDLETQLSTIPGAISVPPRK